MQDSICTDALRPLSVNHEECYASGQSQPDMDHREMLLQIGKQPVEVNKRSGIQLLKNLILVREFELNCERLWHQSGPLVGEFHLSLGQEAIAVGTCAAIRESDLVCPSIRGMGVYLCRGVSMARLMGSFFDKEGGITGGRWPHWHSSVPEVGILPQTGMLGSGLATSVGFAFAQKAKKTGNVVVAMLGDGTSNTGYFHESINIAAVKRLPIVIVIENNQIAVSTPISETSRVANLAVRAGSYGIPGTTIDGNDVATVLGEIGKGAMLAREGGGPCIVECMSYRWGGQTLRDPDRIRPAAEKEAAKANCPVTRYKLALIDQGLLDEDLFEQLAHEVRQVICDAEGDARKMRSLSDLVNDRGAKREDKRHEH